MDDLSSRAQELVAAVGRRTSEVVDALRAQDEDGLGAPSALPGWDRLTIACHLRYGALALAEMTVATMEGRPTSYYPEGRQAQRDKTLSPAPDETSADVVRSLASASGRLQDLWAALPAGDWTREVTEPDDNVDLGVLPLSRLPLLRLTEVEVHGGDLDLELADWSPLFVEVALPFRLDWLNRRRANHRDFDEQLEGSWLLTATDGPSFRVEVAAGHVESKPVPPNADATAVIEGSSRDLLALLLGRPLRQPLRYWGDAAFGRAFTRAFPGP